MRPGDLAAVLEEIWGQKAVQRGFRAPTRIESRWEAGSDTMHVALNTWPESRFIGFQPVVTTRAQLGHDIWRLQNAPDRLVRRLDQAIHELVTTHAYNCPLTWLASADSMPKPDLDPVAVFPELVTWT